MTQCRHPQLPHSRRGNWGWQDTCNILSTAGSLPTSYPLPVVPIPQRLDTGPPLPQHPQLPLSRRGNWGWQDIHYILLTTGPLPTPPTPDSHPTQWLESLDRQSFLPSLPSQKGGIELDEMYAMSHWQLDTHHIPHMADMSQTTPWPPSAGTHHGAHHIPHTQCTPLHLASTHAHVNWHVCCSCEVSDVIGGCQEVLVHQVHPQFGIMPNLNPIWGLGLGLAWPVHLNTWCSVGSNQVHEVCEPDHGQSMWWSLQSSLVMQCRHSA